MFRLLFILLFSVAALSASVQETFVETKGARLYCRISGQGSPLLIVHGGPGLSQDYLLPYLDKLAENNQVIFYDQRGSGRSEGAINQELIQLSVFIEDIEAIRKKLGHEKISILGHSWGGFLAMSYAIAHPESVDKLILMNSMPATSEELGLFIQEWMRRMAPHMQEIHEIENSPLFAAGDPELTARSLKIQFRTFCSDPQKANRLNLFSAPTANIHGKQTGDLLRKSVFFQPYTLLEGLDTLSCKTLIIHGPKDPVPLSSAQTIQSHIRNSILYVIEDCGHFPYVEKPKETFAKLNEFLGAK